MTPGAAAVKVARRLRAGTSYVARWLELARFYFAQRITGFDVPDTPQLDDKGRDYFLKRLAGCQFYLEYGSGGSTVEAARLRKAFVTVDSDRFYLSSVRRKIAQTNGHHHGHEFIYCDIGSTGLWGVPVFKSLTPERIGLWRQYPEAPWARIVSLERLPDLILIDGRFRVACALTTLKHVAHTDSFEMLVDDYAERPYYKEIERFARLTSMQGRMAIFSATEFDSNELNDSIERHVSDWR
jgi:hypothetical protein